MQLSALGKEAWRARWLSQGVSLERRRRGQVLPLCPFQPDTLESPNKDSCLSSGSVLAPQEGSATRGRAVSSQEDAF